MGYIADLIRHQSGTECPESFTTWSGLSLLGALLGRKVWTMHGDYFPVYPNLYICLVGTPGSGKSTAKDFARRIMIKEFGDYYLNADVQSFQDIAKQMGSDGCEKLWKLNGTDSLQSYRPFYCLVDELALFLETNMAGMLQFLTRLFSADDFSTGFKKEAEVGANQKFLNPYFSFLSCTIPDWVMTNLRLDLFQGGLGRRMIIIHDQKSRYVPNPTKPKEAEVIYANILAHLHEAYAESTQGPIVKTSLAQLWWDEWYMRHHKNINQITDPIVAQFAETEHIQMLKIASTLAMDERPFKYQLSDVHLQTAHALLNKSKEQVMRLTSGIGRNELAGIGSQILEYLIRLGGAVPFTQLRQQFRRYLNVPEFQQVLLDFQSTKQISFAEITDEKGESLVKMVGLPGKIALLESEFRERRLKG